MMTKKELLKNIDKGFLNDAAKEINRYGEIADDTSWEEQGGHYKGSNRVTCYTYLRLKFTVEKLNGETISIGYAEIE